MKKSASILAGILTATLLFGGCTPKEAEIPTESTTAPTETQPPTDPTESILFTDPEQLPIIDGSTACLPLMAQVVARTCGLEKEEAEVYVTASKTYNSWMMLLSRSVDLLLAYEMPESITYYLSENDIPLDMTAIGRDALVFLVNDDNPVKSVTRQQLIDIYTGKITNWAEVGGEDKEIIPFQRNSTSGSQTLFEKLLMNGEKAMKAPSEYSVDTMGQLVESISNYNNSANALGFSVYYYVSQMKNDPSLRLLAVDGVEPTPENIANQTYPLTNAFYAVIRSQWPSDSPARTLYNWICGPEGRQAVIDAGYVPAD